MNKSQFFYNVQQQIDTPIINGEVQPAQFKDLQHSFSLDLVLVSIETPTGRTVVLNHMHERNEEIPVRNKQGKVTSVRNQRGMFQTEIQLSSEDSVRFIEASSI